MKFLEIYLNENSIAALLGWIAFNVILLSIYKDENEATFNLKTYASEYWDNWAGSFVLIPVLLYIGYKGLDLGVVDLGQGAKWSDLYYLFSGFAFEALKVMYKKWLKK